MVLNQFIQPQLRRSSMSTQLSQFLLTQKIFSNNQVHFYRNVWKNQLPATVKSTLMFPISEIISAIKISIHKVLPKITGTTNSPSRAIFGPIQKLKYIVEEVTNIECDQNTKKAFILSISKILTKP